MEDMAMVMGLVMVLAMAIVILITTVTGILMDINNLAVTGTAIVDHGVEPAIGDEIKGQGGRIIF
jgi:cytochrome b